MTLINEVKEKLLEYAKKIAAPGDLIPLINESNDFAYPYIEIDNSGVMYVVLRERGVEIKRNFAGRIEDLLYLVFGYITSSMAYKYEAENRIENQDSRKVIFEKQIELLNILNEEWAKRQKWHLQQILKMNG